MVRFVLAIFKFSIFDYRLIEHTSGLWNILGEEPPEIRKKRQIRVVEYSKTEILESPLLCTSDYYSRSSTFTTESNLIQTEKNSKKSLEKRTSIEKRGNGSDFQLTKRSLKTIVRSRSSKNALIKRRIVWTFHNRESWPIFVSGIENPSKWKAKIKNAKSKRVWARGGQAWQVCRIWFLE